MFVYQMLYINRRNSKNYLPPPAWGYIRLVAKGRKKGEETTQFNFRIPTRLLARIDQRLREAELARFPGGTRTKLVLAAIEEYLSKGALTAKNKKG